MLDLALLSAAKAIKLLILDVDGVCTDGKLYFNDSGETLKVFHVHDGLGIKLLQKTGVEVAIITAKLMNAVNYRMQSLGIKHIFQGQEDKTIAYVSLLTTLQLTDDQVAYLGDDLPDLPLIRRVGLGMCVPNANIHVKKEAKWVTQTPGGAGAVREVCELIMQAQGSLDAMLAHYR